MNFFLNTVNLDFVIGDLCLLCVFNPYSNEYLKDNHCIKYTRIRVFIDVYSPL